MDLIRLPFDVYQRYKFMAEIIIQIKSGKNLTILDVGGTHWNIKSFLPEEKVILVDILNFKDKDYIKATAKNLPFKTNKFDIVVASDILEHIPYEAREMVIDELLRVSKDYVLIGAPFKLEKESVEIAENIINYFEQVIKGIEHSWLKEHKNCGLPDLAGFKELLKKKELVFLDFPNGFLSHWLLMMGIRELISSFPNFCDLWQEIDYFYNLNFYRYDNREPSYRRIFLIAKHNTLPFINKEFLMPSSQWEILEKKLETLKKLLNSKLELLENRSEELKTFNENLSTRVKSLEEILNSLLQTKIFKVYHKISQIKKNIFKNG